jgi:hypothetical protein
MPPRTLSSSSSVMNTGHHQIKRFSVIQSRPNETANEEYYGTSSVNLGSKAKLKIASNT